MRGGPGCAGPRPPNDRKHNLLGRATKEAPFKCPCLTQEQCKKDFESSDGSYSMLPIPGRCTQYAYCAPQSASRADEQPYIDYCMSGTYWDPNSKKCTPLPGNGRNSTCEVDKNFKCPRKMADREDCEKLADERGTSV